MMENLQQLNNLCGTPEQPIVGNAKLRLFGQAKLYTDMLSPSRDAVKLFTTHTNYQAMIWLQIRSIIIVIKCPTDTSAWRMESDCLKAVRKAVSYSRCVSTVGSQSVERPNAVISKSLNCTHACGSDEFDCGNRFQV